MASCIFMAYTLLILVGALPAMRARRRLEHASFCTLQAGIGLQHLALQPNSVRTRFALRATCQLLAPTSCRTGLLAKALLRAALPATTKLKLCSARMMASSRRVSPHTAHVGD